MANPQPPAQRPLSPHLFIYRPLLTMMMSIAHRITGAALYLGTLLLAWYLIALSINDSTFATASWVLRSIPGQLVLFGFTVALFHHFMGGVRHALWDVGIGFEPSQRQWLAQGTWIGGLALTMLVWIMSFLVR